MALEDNIRDLARQHARKALAASPSFRSLSESSQREVYRDMVQSEYDKLARESGLAKRQNGLAAGMAKGDPGASKNINDERHDRILDTSDQAENFEEFKNTVDFPQFVKDLLKSVFDANIAVIKEQNETFMDLMKAATTDIAKFIKQVDDTTAMAHLADNSDDGLSLDFEDDEEEEGGQRAVLRDKDGEAVDMGDNQLKARIMESKIELAKQHQATLKQMVAMGATRIVVKDGRVKAGVIFDFSANRKLSKRDKAMNKIAESKGKSGGFSGGLIGSIFGGPRYGSSSSRRETNLSVSSAASEAEDTMKAKLTGDVEINFATDYAPLGDFINKMYETEQKAIEAKAGLNNQQNQQNQQS